MQKYYEAVFNAEGRIEGGFRVSVRHAQTKSLAVIYADRLGEQVLENPFYVKADGRMQFYAPNGNYDLSLPGQLVKDVLLYDPNDPVPACVHAEDFDGLPGCRHLVQAGAAPLTVTLPQGVGLLTAPITLVHLDGDIEAQPLRVDFNGHKFRGEADAELLLNTPQQVLRLIFSTVEHGWVLV